MPKKGRGRGKKSQAKLELLVCSYCEESFLQTADFENHIELPHVQCQYCDRFFSSVEKLEEHVGDLHLVTTRDWDCSTCGLSFVTEEEKSNHDKLHYIPEKLPSSQKDCPGPEPLEVEDSDYVKVPEEDLVNVSEGKEGSDPMGNGSTGELEIGSAEAEPEPELASTLCPECAPAVERMLANILRRVVEQLQE